MWADNVMNFAGITLAAAYILAAFVRVYAGLLRASLRKAYWLSSVACLALAANQIWLLVTDVPVSSRIIFAQGSALALAASAVIQPPLIVLREHRSRSLYLPKHHFPNEQIE